MGVTTLTRGEVLENYGVELTRFAASLVGPSDAQDVVSDALVRSMWSDGWEGVDNQRAYLYRAVADQARMNHRSASRRRQRESSAARPVSTPSGERYVDVWEALDHLNVIERGVIFLTYWEDLSEFEVAARLEMSDRTVRRHLGRARMKLGSLLE